MVYSSIGVAGCHGEEVMFWLYVLVAFVVVFGGIGFLAAYRRRGGNPLAQRSGPSEGDLEALRSAHSTVQNPGPGSGGI
jgi:hypothetical protein